MKARSNHPHQPYLDRWSISHLEPLNIYCFFCLSDSIIYSSNVYHRYHCTHMYVFANLSNGCMTASVFERYIYGVLETHKYSTYTGISSGMKARSNHHHQPYLDRWIISHLEPLNISCFFCSSDSIIYSNSVYHRYHCTHMYVFCEPIQPFL